MKPPPALIPILQNITAFSFLATAKTVNHIDPGYDSPVWNVGQSVRTTIGLVLGHSVRQKTPTSPSMLEFHMPPFRLDVFISSLQSLILTMIPLMPPHP